MQQIILVTDGCSNVGISPVVAASYAYQEGIVVHVVGIVDEGEIGRMGTEEITETARAGGGLSRIVPSSRLAQTMQMLTRKTVAHTIKQAVGEELRRLMGSPSVEMLPPDRRADVVRVMEDMAESADLRVALLIDSSASMKPKLRAVEEAVRDLMHSLRARTGNSELAVFRFPGKDGEELHMELDWTGELAKIRNLFYNINMKGTTPTGPAIVQAVRLMTGQPEAGSDFDGRKQRVDRHGGEDGMLNDYIV